MAGELLLISGLEGSPMSGWWSNLTGSKTDGDKVKALVARLDLLLKTNSDRLGDSKATAYSKLLNELNTRRKSAENNNAATKVVLSQLVQLVAAVNKDIGPTKEAREKGKVAMSGLSGTFFENLFKSEVTTRGDAVVAQLDAARKVLKDDLVLRRMIPSTQDNFSKQIEALDRQRQIIRDAFKGGLLSEKPAVDKLKFLNSQARQLRDQIEIKAGLKREAAQPAVQAPAQAPVSTSWFDTAMQVATQGRPVVDTQPAQAPATPVQDTRPSAPAKKESPWYMSPYALAGGVAVGVAAMYFGYTLWHKKAAPKLEELLDD